MDSETIDGRMNIQTVSIPQFHEMKGPHRSINCKDRAMATIQGSVEKDQSVSVKINSDGYEITSPIGTYYWQRVGKTFDGTRDRMKLVAFKELGAIHHSTQVVGEAFSSGNYDTIISLDQLGGRYDGLINHKDMNATSEEDWITRRSIIDFSRFTPNQSASLVRGYTTPGQPDVIKKYGKSMYVQHSVTILNFRSTHMKPILHEYGHDFNDNGCFDEQGHNKLLLPIITGGIVSELVYIEYTPDNRNPKDQVPMLSVGCYFLAH
jgi:hypothetical protein